MQQHDILVAETRALAAAFREAGCESFATKLENASEYLYTFILYPGMEPTNNIPERMLRPSVIARKIFQGLRTEEGMEMFTVLMTCTMDWRAQGRNVSEIDFMRNRFRSGIITNKFISFRSIMHKV